MPLGCTRALARQPRRRLVDAALALVPFGAGGGRRLLPYPPTLAGDARHVVVVHRSSAHLSAPEPVRSVATRNVRASGPISHSRPTSGGTVSSTVRNQTRMRSPCPIHGVIDVARARRVASQAFVAAVEPRGGRARAARSEHGPAAACTMRLCDTDLTSLRLMIHTAEAPPSLQARGASGRKRLTLTRGRVATCVSVATP